ncbi:MAG: flagellar hook-associated protein FlgL [candidate division Zixibacteria bacterium]|nr:flagellar hook-associated protein FlgL [candidate division Zixibacteria bacterium]
MRVTNAMITSRVLSNTQRALARFMNMQTQMSSGRRINRPSDDPLGTIRDLDIRAELAKTAQYKNNIYQAQNWVQVYDSGLAEMKNMATTAKEITVTMANATQDSTGRAIAGVEIRSLIDQMFQMSEEQLEGKYVFSGFRTNQKPLQMTNTGVTYVGDSGKIEFQIGAAVRRQVNLNGDNVFLKHLSDLGSDADLNVGLSATTLLSDLNSSNGISQVPGTIRIIDQNLGISVDVDLSAAVTIGDVTTTINNALTANVPPINNLTVAVGGQGNNLSFTTIQSGLISTSTPLANLNGGTGVDLSTGSIRLTDGAALNLNIDLTGSTTVNDIITKFNAAIAADPAINNVTIQLNAANTGFEIIDANGVPLGLSVQETDALSTTAASLGIQGNIAPNLVGTDLNPVVDFKVEENGDTTALDLGILSQFNGDRDGSDLDPALALTSNVADLNSTYGQELGVIEIRQGNTVRSVDLSAPTIVTIQDMLDALNDPALGLDIIASINADNRGIQIVNNNQTTSLSINDIGTGRVAKEMGIFGSGDMMGSLLVLADSLEANDAEGVGLLMQNMDDAIEHLLYLRAGIGARGLSFEDTSTRLVDIELTYTRRLSEVEDADITRLVTELATYENNFKASLIASAKIIQPSLLDFLW